MARETTLPNLVQLRLPDDLAKAIDTYRRRQFDLPSRSEAIRRLVSMGLKVPVIGLGDLVTHRDGRHGTVIGTDDPKRSLMVNVEFYLDDDGEEEEWVPLQLLTVSHAAAEGRGG